MNRRKLLLGSGVALTTTIAGCSSNDTSNGNGGGNGNGNGSGSGTGEVSPPDPETPTSDLLPDTEEWPLDDESEQMAGMIGANDGVQGQWDGPDGERYSMEIMRFGEKSSAEDAAEEVYGDWFLSFAHGVFTFAVNGPDGDHARDLLAASPALNESMVDAKT
ncbi:hypothetical protein [Natrinema thermotolerans]